MRPLIDSLYKGIVTVVFEKVDTGAIRTMPCTLNKDIHKQSMEIKSFTSDTNMLMYALDKQAWRDVRINTIIEWYEGMPKEEK